MPTCTVCGYPDLDEPPRSPAGGGSYEICPSCGFQFGVDDDDKGMSHEEWRMRWAEKGRPWSSRGIPMPKGWDAQAQLAAVTASARPARKPTRKLPAKPAKSATVARKPPPPKTKKSKPSGLSKKSARKKR